MILCIIFWSLLLRSDLLYLHRMKIYNMRWKTFCFDASFHNLGQWLNCQRHSPYRRNQYCINPYIRQTTSLWMLYQEHHQSTGCEKAQQAAHIQVIPARVHTSLGRNTSSLEYQLRVFRSQTSISTFSREILAHNCNLMILLSTGSTLNIRQLKKRTLSNSYHPWSECHQS